MAHRAGQPLIVGTVVRLQVQRSRLKPGPPTTRVYDPSPLLEVDALEVGPRGCIGLLAGERILDVHHADHRDTRNNRLANGLSLLPVEAYPALRARYGDHLVDGVIGESLLLQIEGGWPPGDLLLDTDDQPLRLSEVRPASPCVEFTRFCLGLVPGPVGADVRQGLLDLDGGARGYYARVTGKGTVRRGNVLRSA